MKPILLLLVMACVAHRLVADEPKTSSQKSMEEINRQLKALHKRMGALEKEQMQLQKESEELLKNGTPVHVKQHPEGKFGYVMDDTQIIKGGGIDPKKIRVFPTKPELNAAEYMTPRMSTESAERHSAEKIERLVREADARAKRILDGRPPSLVHGD
jgi:hypothetical protein